MSLNRSASRCCTATWIKCPFCAFQIKFESRTTLPPRAVGTDSWLRGKTLQYTLWQLSVPVWIQLQTTFCWYRASLKLLSVQNFYQLVVSVIFMALPWPFWWMNTFTGYVTGLRCLLLQSMARLSRQTWEMLCKGTLCRYFVAWNQLTSSSDRMLADYIVTNITCNIINSTRIIKLGFTVWSINQQALVNCIWLETYPSN